MAEFEIRETAHYLLWAAANGELIHIYVDGQQVAAHEVSPNLTGTLAVSADFWTTSGEYTQLRAGQRVSAEPDDARLIVRKVSDSDGSAVYDSHPHLRANH